MASVVACTAACKPAAAPADAATAPAPAFDAGTPGHEVTTIAVDAGLWFEEHKEFGATRKVVQQTPDGPARLTEDTNGDGAWDATEEHAYKDGKQVFSERREDRDYDGKFDRRHIRELTPEGKQRRVTFELVPVEGGPPGWKATSESIVEPSWE